MAASKSKEDYQRTDRQESPPNPATSDAYYNRAIQGLGAIPVTNNIRNPGYDDNDQPKPQIRGGGPDSR